MKDRHCACSQINKYHYGSDLPPSASTVQFTSQLTLVPVYRGLHPFLVRRQKDHLITESLYQILLIVAARMMADTIRINFSHMIGR